MNRLHLVLFSEFDRSLQTAYFQNWNTSYALRFNHDRGHSREDKH